MKIAENLIQDEHQIYIIIDALDECKEMDKVWEFCMKIISSFQMIGIIVSSRNNQPENYNYFTVSLGKNSMVDKDIAAFIEKHILSNSKTLKVQVIETLIKKADGGFRYIDCQLQTLKECANQNQICKVLAKLPVDLKETYAEAIRKCQKSIHSKNAYYILLWLLNSFTPLYIDQVAVILSIDLEEKSIDADTEMLIGLEKIVDTTLVTVGANNIVQLAHASVKEFLLESSSDLNTYQLFDTNAQLAHNTIAQMCLIYLLNPSTNQPIYQAPKCISKITLESLETDVIFLMWKKDIITFGQYAVEYWAKHSQYNEKTGISCEDTIQLTLKFLKNGFEPFVNWKNVFQNIDCQKTWKKGTFADCNSLHIGAFFGFSRSVQKILVNFASEDEDINALEKNMGTPLQIAIVNGFKDTTKFFLQHGAHVNAQGGKYGTALQAAASRGYRDIVELLIQYGADVNEKNEGYEIAIQKALTVEGFYSQHLRVVPTQDSYEAATQLAELEVEDDYRFALEPIADNNDQRGKFGTALQAAASEGHKDIVELLIQHGANVNAQGGYYGTALQAAAGEGYKDIVKLLIQSNANINAKGGHYRVVLQAAHGSEWNVFEVHGSGTAIGAAAFGGHIDIIKFLLQRGANVDAEFDTAMNSAIFKGDKNFVEFLVQHGANVNAQGVYNGTQGKIFRTALQAAKSSGHKDIIEFLIQHGANENIQNDEHRTIFQKSKRNPVELTYQYNKNISNTTALQIPIQRKST
ncbi:ankyrin repeat-containing domain protein [Lentinula raphanica]|uniref:Ankyrin repeat-containing domain protein n=1 Tax=Lentinula raphanica TaxID=153919 RepID=A0AA38PCN7_9AGAR|nr:ankyrin repeat-containing domain protein [Lentinula raphanica]